MDSNQLRITTNGHLGVQGSSALSVNAPEFVPGGNAVHPQMIMNPNMYHNPGNVGQDWQHMQQHGGPQPPPAQFNQGPQYQYTPYAPQQPNADVQAFAAMNQRMSNISINTRLHQFHPQGAAGVVASPQQLQQQQQQQQQQQHQPQGSGYNHVDGARGPVGPRQKFNRPPLGQSYAQQVSNGGGGNLPQQQQMGHPRQRGGRNNGPGGSGGGFNHHNNHHSNAQIHNKHNNSNVPSSSPLPDTAEDDSHQPTEAEDAALSFLAEVIAKLEDNPGLFETYQKRLKEIFYDLANNNFVMSNSLEMLFKQSAKSQNFRYMGARICNLLDELESSEDSLFRTLLRLKMEFEMSELNGFMQNETHVVRGTTLFMAELYMQLRRPHSIARNYEIASSIIAAVQLLLSRPTPENLKCVCQTLKLCGFELDLDNPHKMEEIIKQLEPNREKFDTSTTRLIQSVIDLRSKRWGRTEAFVIPVASDIHLGNEYSDGPVFYGPDGQILTEEENSFLASNLPSQLIEDVIGDDDSGDDLVDDDDNAYDLEIKLAFKEFVNSSKAQKK